MAKKKERLKDKLTVFLDERPVSVGKTLTDDERTTEKVSVRIDNEGASVAYSASFERWKDLKAVKFLKRLFGKGENHDKKMAD
jgi:hypothetical protein